MHVGSKKLLREKISLVYYIIIKNKNRNKYEINLIEIKKSLKNDNKSIENEVMNDWGFGRVWEIKMMSLKW